MTEIEKMFENAGIRICKRKQGFTLKDCTDRECKECGYYDLSFTAEKQLKIIEWFISYRWWLNLKSLDKKLDFFLYFDEKLAKLVNRLWESFDKQEKEEIRGILNENS